MKLTGTRFLKYAENVFWLVFEKGFGLFVGLVVGIYVARYLQPESYGLLNYAISFVSIFSAFSTLGIDQIIVRELSKGEERKDDLLGTSFILKLGGSVFLFALMGFILLFMDHNQFTNTLIMIIAGAELLKGFEVVNYYFQARILSKHVIQVQLLINFMMSLAKIGLVLMRAPLIWFAVVITVTSILNAAGYYYTYQRNIGSPRKWVFKKLMAYELLRESWPLALYGIALNIQARIDQVMLGKMMNNYEVGQYSVALKFIEIFGFVPMILMNTFMPAITQAREVAQSLYHSRLINLYRLMFLTFVLVSVPIYFFAEDLIRLLYGAEYQAAGYLLSLFALRLFFSNMGVGKSVFIVNESLFKYSLLTVVVGAISNITLNYFLIPLKGPTGAILASMISFTVSIFLVDTFFSKTRENQKLMFKGIFSFWKLSNIV